LKSQERIDKEREKRKMLWFILSFVFILMILILLMIFGSTGVGGAMNGFFYNIQYNIIDVWNKITFKLSGFFVFLKR